MLIGYTTLGHNNNNNNMIVPLLHLFTFTPRHELGWRDDVNFPGGCHSCLKSNYRRKKSIFKVHYKITLPRDFFFVLEHT